MPEPFEKIQTRMGIINNQETWLNASHSFGDPSDIFIHNKTASGFFGGSEKKMGFARTGLADEHKIACGIRDFGDVIVSAQRWNIK
jgi:hypothetical protein